MTVKLNELKARRIAFRKLIKELGLPPQATHPDAPNWTFSKVSEADNPILNAVKNPNDQSPVNEWLVAPFTPYVAQEFTQTPSGIVVDFLETAQTAQQFGKQLNDFVKNPDEARSIAVIVGPCMDDFPKAKTSTVKFSDLIDEQAHKHWAHMANLQRQHRKIQPTTPGGRAAVVQNIRDCDKLKVNDPTKSLSPGNWANCAVHTIFVHSATSQEVLGGPDTTVFLNYIPNQVLSRAVPILNITVDLPDGIEKRKLIQALGPSLILGQKIGLKGNPQGDALFTKTLSGDPNNPNLPRRSIGSDTFNAPQTLGRTRDQYAAFLNEPDPLPENQFSPLGIIQDFNFQFDGGDLASLLTREQAKGELTLMFPDKTKITGLDQLLIGTNGLLSLTIEFGWSIMPNQIFEGDDGVTSRDPMIDYVNRQRIRIGASTTLNGIEFSDAGAAKVTLGLTDPATQDKVEGVGIEDVSHYMKIINKSNPRFINFIMNVLQDKANQPSDDIAEATGYKRTISKVFGSSRVDARTNEQKTRIEAFNKSKKKYHYKLDKLSAIKKGEADNELILEHLNTVEQLNMDSIKGYDYAYIDMTAGGFYPESLKAIADVIDEAIAELGKKASKHFNLAKTKKSLDVIRAAASSKTVFIRPPAGKKFRAKPHENYASVERHRTSLIKALNKVPAKTRDPLKAKIGFDDTSEDGFAAMEAIATKRTLDIMPFLSSDKLIPIPGDNTADGWKPATRSTFKHLQEKGIVPETYVHLGKVKLEYPHTLQPAMTKSQKAKRDKAMAEVQGKTLDAVSSKSLKEARIGTVFYTYKHILSNGFILQTKQPPGSKGKRFIDNEGTDVHAKVLKGSENLPLGGIMKWWYTHQVAENFIPFSHMVHFCLVQPLYASGQFDEIQVVYFKLNANCGRMSSHSIADIPIKQDLNAIFRKYSSPYSFINKVINKQINVWNSATPYGFQSISKMVKKNKTIKVLAPNQTVPKVEYLTRILYAEDPDNPNGRRKILRLSFYDHFSTADRGAGQRVMNSMREDGRTTAMSNTTTENTMNSETIREKMLVKALETQGVLSEQRDPLGERDINVGPKTWRIIKAAFKASHAHLNYGTIGSALLRASISGKMDGREQMAQHVAAQKSKDDTSGQARHSKIQAGIAPDIPIAEITGASRSVDIEMVGCPMLQVGSMYFIDFYTGTDVDNFYICKAVKHTLSNNSFKTTATFHLWDSKARVTIPDSTEGLEKMIAQNKTD